MANLDKLPPDFKTPLQVQCVVTRRNQDRLEGLVQALVGTRVGWMTFSFYVPRKDDATGNAWSTLEERDATVREVMRLKEKYEGFVRNTAGSLKLMLSDTAKSITDHCPSRHFLLPLYLEGKRFVTPFCCYGNDVDCDRCGAWVVFHFAEKMGVPPGDHLALTWPEDLRPNL